MSVIFLLTALPEALGPRAAPSVGKAIQADVCVCSLEISLVLNHSACECLHSHCCIAAGCKPTARSAGGADVQSNVCMEHRAALLPVCPHCHRLSVRIPAEGGRGVLYVTLCFVPGELALHLCSSFMPDSE